MAKAARQVATLAVLVSQHTVVTCTHRAVIALQREEQERRQQQLQLFVRIRMVGKVKTNASTSLQMFNDHYKCQVLAFNKNGLRLPTSWPICTTIYRIAHVTIINKFLSILTSRRYPSGNSMVISLCHPVRLIHDQMERNLCACKAYTLCKSMQAAACSSAN